MLLYIIIPILVNILYLSPQVLAANDRNYEIIDFEFEGDKWVEADLQLKRISKYENALTGYLDFKKDVTDVTHFDVRILKSENGDGDYKPSPFYVPMTPLTKVMNTFYKNLLKNIFDKCVANHPEFVDDSFQAPLKKGRMVFDNCLIKSDDIDQNFSPGFYKIINTSHGEVNFAVTLTVQVENKE